MALEEGGNVRLRGNSIDKAHARKKVGIVRKTPKPAVSGDTFPKENKPELESYIVNVNGKFPSSFCFSRNDPQYVDFTDTVGSVYLSGC